MTANLKRTEMGLASAVQGSRPQESRRHRHKRFHVRPEARGQGYAAYNILEQSGSLAASEEDEPGVTSSQPDVEWEKVSEREIRWRAAQHGLRICIYALMGAVVLIWIIGYRGWAWRIFDWLHQFPMPVR
jgi:hypothetical protein